MGTGLLVAIIEEVPFHKHPKHSAEVRPQPLDSSTSRCTVESESVLLGLGMVVIWLVLPSGQHSWCTSR